MCFVDNDSDTVYVIKLQGGRLTHLSVQIWCVFVVVVVVVVVIVADLVIKCLREDMWLTVSPNHLGKSRMLAQYSLNFVVVLVVNLLQSKKMAIRKMRCEQVKIATLCCCDDHTK